MLKRVALFLAVGLLLAFALAACGGDDEDNGGSSGSSGGGKTTVTMTDDMKFNPSTITVKAGEKVTIDLQNKGALVHDMTLTVGGKKEQKVLDGGKSGEFTFTAPSQAGDVPFICSQPGHEAAGMKGTLKVQ